MEQSDRATAAYMGQLEDRVDRKSSHSAAPIRSPVL